MIELRGAEVQAGLRLFAESRYASESDLMKRFVSISFAIFSCLCLMVATERRAYAYVDPGSGVMALQAMASVMAAAVYFLRKKIKVLFTRDRAKKPVKPTLVLPVTALGKNDSRSNSQTAA